ncbi:LpqB family beta-propeller domain-containing protein [Microbacterium sp. NPDC096154]|uniref:LpqB family beta-propeller domain-containing protein n=1 Tax=Microbacterium sp. NPDC096154 TaxID=3155549 RepID=UPI0033290B3C
MRPATVHRSRAIAVLLALVLALAGCTGLPTSGPVTAGRVPGEAAEDPPTQFFAYAPARGATPEEIVTGFVEAAISPLSSWETARLFLADSLAESWRPEAGVIVDVADDRRYEVTGDDSVTLNLTPTATVDEHGTYTTAASGSVELGFRLTQREDGEWRIVEAPDGIVLDRQNFPDVYSDHRLAYFDPTWTYLVPDVRWFPTSGNTATYIVRELVDGAPSPWLAGSVASAFAQDIDLSTGAVPVDTDQVAHIELNAVAAGADTTALSRMAAQLDASLANTGVQSVRLTIAGESSPVQVDPVQPAQTRPDSRALVLRNGELGFLSGSELTPLEGLSDAIEDMEGQIDSIAVAPDRQVAAVQQSTGLVYRVTADSPDRVDERDDLIAPVIDPFGYVWTVPADDPGAVVAWDPDLEPFPLAGGWSEASRVHAMAMSRDGSRVAALVTVGGEQFAMVASVRRDRAGRPTGLGDAMRTAELAQPGVSIAWIEDARLGIVTSEGDEASVIEQQVGGQAERSNAPNGTRAIEFGTQDSSVRLLGAEGLLYMRRGSSWQQTGSEVSVLATQMGAPQNADG